MNAQEQLRWQIIGAHRLGCTNSVIERSFNALFMIYMIYMMI